MYDTDDIEVRFSTKYLPLEYKLLEFRLMINKDLYDEKVIDFNTFKIMEQSLIARITKIKNEYKDKMASSNNKMQNAT